MMPKSEKLFRYRGFWIPGNFLSASEKQEIYDDLLLMEKKLANEIYITRCKEKFL